MTAPGLSAKNASSALTGARKTRTARRGLQTTSQAALARRVAAAAARTGTARWHASGDNECALDAAGGQAFECRLAAVVFDELP